MTLIVTDLQKSWLRRSPRPAVGAGLARHGGAPTTKGGRGRALPGLGKDGDEGARWRRRARVAEEQQRAPWSGAEASGGSGELQQRLRGRAARGAGEGSAGGARTASRARHGRAARTGCGCGGGRSGRRERWVERGRGERGRGDAARGRRGRGERGRARWLRTVGTGWRRHVVVANGVRGQRAEGKRPGASPLGVGSRAVGPEVGDGDDERRAAPAMGARDDGARCVDDELVPATSSGGATPGVGADVGGASAPDPDRVVGGERSEGAGRSGGV
nr:glycine-rich protein 1-like [Aegilops tauschii subsp. strangulata]